MIGITLAVSGLSYILENFPVKTFFSATPLEKLPLQLQRAVKSNGTEFHLLSEGKTALALGENRSLAHLTLPQNQRRLN